MSSVEKEVLQRALRRCRLPSSADPRSDHAEVAAAELEAIERQLRRVADLQAETGFRIVPESNALGLPRDQRGAGYVSAPRNGVEGD